MRRRVEILDSVLGFHEGLRCELLVKGDRFTEEDHRSKIYR